jgi:solute carrier family 24 (sodium/potassium/calcium exchanger), member 6
MKSVRPNLLLLNGIFAVIYASSTGSSRSKHEIKELKKTGIGFLDDLSATQSFSDTEVYSFKKAKKPAALEAIEESEFETEEVGVKAVVKGKKEEGEEEDKVPPTKPEEIMRKEASKVPSSGPSEEDRLIDDKLTFMISYYDLYEKLGCPSNPLKHFLFILIMSLILAILFYLMYSISSDYLTPSLAHLSAACRMSPDMAGLTFLAFGNGAPDLFTAMLGAEDAPEMILGSSIGSGLFIFTVVFGLVIIFARDPANITQSNSTAIILSFPSPKSANSPVKIGKGTFWRNALMYSGCVLALAIFVLTRKVPIWQPMALIVLFFVYLFASIGAHYLLPSSKKKLEQRKGGNENNLEKGGGNESEDPVNGTMKILEIERRRYKLQQISIFEQFNFAFIEITEWRELGWFGKSFWILTCPLRLILNLTILPLPDPTLIEESTDKLLAHWFLSRYLITVNPFGSVLLLGWLSGFGEFLIKEIGVTWTLFVYLITVSILILMFHLGNNSISNPLSGNDNNWKTSLPLWLATVYSFTCCIAWIFAVSNELVAGLSSLGLILGVSRTVMGCLVLAWGNSIGDLIADIALARNGAPQTAITAIFSGPVQNVLLTIGISFMAAAAQSPDKVIKMSQLRGDVHLSLALLTTVICACLILIPGYFKYRIPRQFGVCLVLVYVIYVPFSLWLGINH